MTALIWALVGYWDRGQRALGGLRASLLRCRGFSCILPASLEAVAVAVHLQDVDVVGEAVKQSAGEPLGSEDVGPLVEGEVGGDQDGAPFVALAEDLEEQFRAVALCLDGCDIESRGDGGQQHDGDENQLP